MIVQQMTELAPAASTIPRQHGFGPKVPCLHPQNLGLPQRNGPDTFGCGASYIAFNADESLRATGLGIFEARVAALVNPRYFGPVLLDHEFCLPLTPTGDGTDYDPWTY